MIAVIKGVKPKDQLETMAATQMAGVHSLTMNMVSRLNGSFTLPQLDITERALNKLARTFAAQVETLKRYRSTGDQRVTVEHVTVNDGGKAIIGNVIHGGGRVLKKIQRRPHERGVSISEKPALLGDFKANSEAVQGTRGDRLDRLPISRGAWWRTERQTQRNVSPWPFHKRGRGRAAHDSRAFKAVR